MSWLSVKHPFSTVWPWSVDFWNLLIQKLGSRGEGVVAGAPSRRPWVSCLWLWPAWPVGAPPPCPLSAAEAQDEPGPSAFSRRRARLHIWRKFRCLGSELANGMRSVPKTDCKTERTCPTRPCSQCEFLLRDSVFSKEWYSISHFLKPIISSFPFPGIITVIS